MKTTIQKQIKGAFSRVKKGLSFYIICPECGRGELGYSNGYWHCLWRDCYFKTNEIPSKEEMENLIQFKKNLQLLKEWDI